MLQQIFIGIVLATVTGVSWFAYKHPLAYKAIWRYFFMFLIAPTIGYMFTFLTNPYFKLSGKLQYMLTENKAEILLTTSELEGMVQSIESFFFVGLVLIGISIYLVILRFLPDLIHATENKT